MLLAVASACQRLLTAFNDFWVLAGLTDWSYEEGERSDEFGDALESYESAGVPDPLVASLRLGINGNLAGLLKESKGPQRVRRNQGRGHDLILIGTDENSAANLEVKLVSDCTYRRYYSRVAQDWDKLLETRRRGFRGGLYLVVFFVQFPHYRYRSGLGTRATVFCGIVNQYEALRRHLIHDPVWPGPAGPEIHPLRIPSVELSLAVCCRFDEKQAGRTTESFVIAPHLVDAGVGACVWEVPTAPI